MGELPDQLQSNLQILSGAQAQLQAAVDARDKAVQQQAYLNSLAIAVRPNGRERSRRRQRRSPMRSSSMLLRAELAVMESKYTPDHPDVKKLKDTISRWSRCKKTAQAATPARRGQGRTAVRLLSAAMTPVMQIQSQLKANKLEIQSREAQIARLEAKVNAVPGKTECHSWAAAGTGRHHAQLR